MSINKVPYKNYIVVFYFESSYQNWSVKYTGLAAGSR